MTHIRPIITDIPRETEKHTGDWWTEQDFDIAMHDDKYNKYK